MAKSARSPTPARTAALSPNTLSDINDLAVHGAGDNVTMMHSPSNWRKVAKGKVKRKWYSLDFPPDSTQRKALPKKPGVYVFYLMPDLFDLPQASALLYVGKATSLYARVSHYLGQIDSRFQDSNRPAVWRMVNVWHGYLRYFYTITANAAQAAALEKRMLSALAPPANKQLPGTLGKRMRAIF